MPQFIDNKNKVCFKENMNHKKSTFKGAFFMIHIFFLNRVTGHDIVKRAPPNVGLAST